MCFIGRPSLLTAMKELRGCLWIFTASILRCRSHYAHSIAANYKWIHIWGSWCQLSGKIEPAHVGCDLKSLSSEEQKTTQVKDWHQDSRQLIVREHMCQTMWKGGGRPTQHKPQMNFTPDSMLNKLVPSVEMYRRLLKECTITHSLSRAKQVLEHLITHGSECIEHLSDSLVATFVKCYGLQDVLQFFHSLPGRTVISWTAVISGHVNVGQGREALAMYQLMLEESLAPDKYTFVAVLRACGSISALQEGKYIHAEVLRYRFESDLMVSTCLLDMYGKCGSILDAEIVFHGPGERDVVSWNAMLAVYILMNRGESTLQLYEQMIESRVCPDHRTLVSVIQACGMLADTEEPVVVNRQPTKAKALTVGKAINVEAARQGYNVDVFVMSSLVNMYGKCGSLVDAKNVFSFRSGNVVTWNAMVSVLVEKGHGEEALQLYREMVEEGVCPDLWTLVRMIQACSMLAEKEEGTVGDRQLSKPVSLHRGKAIHFEAWKNGHKSDVFVGNNLVSMYGNCKNSLDAYNVFDQLSQPDLVSWNAMLAAYAQNGEPRKALLLYEKLLEHGESPNDRTLVSVLQVCGMLAEEDHALGQQSTYVRYLEIGKAIHHEALRRGLVSDVFVASSLISMYGKCGSILDAQHLFQGLHEGSVAVCNAMLVAYVGLSSAENALLLYEQILEEGLTPDDRTYVSALQACGILAEESEYSGEVGQLTHRMFLSKGKAIHAEAWSRGYESDVFIGNTLVSLYSKCRSLEDAENAFDSAAQRDVVSWNALIGAYTQQGQAPKALLLYEQMLEEGVGPDNWTFISMAQAFGLLAAMGEGLNKQVCRLSALGKGKAIHAEAWKKGCRPDFLFGNTLVSMYWKCGSIDDAQNVFNELSVRYVSAWNAMLAAYVQHGEGERALQLYGKMQEEGAGLSLVTVVFAFQACSTAGSWDVCNQMHHHLVTTGFELNLLLANTLIHAYGACGGIVEAQHLFEALPEKDVVSWNALMSGYSRQGDTLALLRCFERMQLAGLEPDGLTYVSLITACSHGGLVDKGLGYFESMWKNHGILPAIEHYVCVVDLLGRAGYFTLVEDFLLSMPLQPSVAVWMCLLGACRKYGNVELGSLAFDFAVHLQPQAAAAYVMMSNIYADAGLWDEAKTITELRHRAAAGKKIGLTWIGHETEVHAYCAGEPRQAQQRSLSRLLRKLKLQLR